MKSLIIFLSIASFACAQSTYRFTRITAGETFFDPVTKVSSSIFAVDASGNLVLKPFTDFSPASGINPIAITGTAGMGLLD